MCKTCPFFGKCGGCKFDFTAPDYHEQKLSLLRNILISGTPVWIAPGARRRADFAFAGNDFGFFESGTKNIVPVRACPNLLPEINNILPQLAQLPWGGTGSCLVTVCDNGIDVAISSSVPYVTAEFRRAAQNIPAIRVTWNDKIIKQTASPIVNFAGHTVEYPTGAFLQPCESGADALRHQVVEHANGFSRVADLFCGLGNFTFTLNADGFDIVGTGVKRDLFKSPLTIGMLKQYDCIVMDPPRAGAHSQCRVLATSDIKRIIYVSCNPATFMRDMTILTDGGYQLSKLTPVDQFPGSSHWELVGVFDK